LTVIKNTGQQTGGRLAIAEQTMPLGPAAPLHVHHREGEWFYVIEGELIIWAGGQVVEAPQGSLAYGPPEVPHTFDVASGTARFLVITQPTGFEDFVRTVSEPAKAMTLPPAGGAPPDPAQLAAVAAGYGIEILGPPGIPT
jgi:mannose-6-phosphate isomerase-like protein (cupin superfamily)